MSKVAIDIVLLPPEDIMNLCIDINQKSSDISANLNKTDNLPHLSLAMTAVDENNLAEINKKMEVLAKKYLPLNLEISELYYEPRPNNKKMYLFRIKPTDELMNLHLEIMKELKPFTLDEVTLDMFYKDPGEIISETSVTWTKDYIPKHSGKKGFNPHLTLRCGDAQYDGSFPVKFIATNLAVTQLGDHSTCRKIFKSFEIS